MGASIRLHPSRCLDGRSVVVYDPLIPIGCECDLKDEKPACVGCQSTTGRVLRKTKSGLVLGVVNICPSCFSGWDERRRVRLVEAAARRAAERSDMRVCDPPPALVVRAVTQVVEQDGDVAAAVTGEVIAVRLEDSAQLLAEFENLGVGTVPKEV